MSFIILEKTLHFLTIDQKTNLLSSGESFSGATLLSPSLERPILTTRPASAGSKTGLEMLPNMKGYWILNDTESWEAVPLVKLESAL